MDISRAKQTVYDGVESFVIEWDTDEIMVFRKEDGQPVAEFAPADAEHALTRTMPSNRKEAHAKMDIIARILRDNIDNSGTIPEWMSRAIKDAEALI